MESIIQKLTYLLATKDQIRSAIASKGVTVPADTPFRGYPEQIRKIKTGGYGFSAEGHVMPSGVATMAHGHAMTIRATGQTTT